EDTALSGNMALRCVRVGAAERVDALRESNRRDGWAVGVIRTAYRLAATVLKVVLRLSVRLTELMATKEPITISAAISPYSIAVTPPSSLISLLSKITIDRLYARFNRNSASDQKLDR